jgi:hypothetical protein
MVKCLGRNGIPHEGDMTIASIFSIHLNPLSGSACAKAKIKAIADSTGLLINDF